MPLAAVPWLVRLGMKSSGIPARFYADVLAEARTATLDSLTHVTLESIRFRIPAGLKPPAPQTAAVRTLVLAGQKEYRLMRDAARDLAAAIPHAEGRLVQNGIHAWNMQYPDLCAETIRAWIRGQPLPAELLPLER
jgi:pimeloyl-ACP methyl ester carboxylesterase